MIAATLKLCCCCCCCCCINDGPEEVEAADDEGAGDVVEFVATEAADEGCNALLPVAEERLFSSEPIDSSRCHLELRAALI